MAGGGLSWTAPRASPRAASRITVVGRKTRSGVSFERTVMIGKVKHPAVLLLVLICAMAAVPASADVLYDQITPSTPTVPGSYNVGGLNIYGGYFVTDRFELSQDSVADSAQVALWVQNRDYSWQTGATGTVTSVDWAITTAAFGPVLASHPKS